MSDEKTPPERRLELVTEKLIEYLKDEPEAYNIREHNGTVDFVVGDPDLWPDYGNDDHVNVIKASSVDFNALLPEEKGVASQSNPQMGQNIHLPPAHEDLWDELQDAENFSETFTLVNGTFQLGSLMPPPDGVCTPHLLLVEDAELAEVIGAIDEIFRLYEGVYENGDRIIKEQP